MRKTALAAALALLASLPAYGIERGEDALRRDIDFAKGKVYPALVNIQVVVREFSGGRSTRIPGAGSGVIVSPAGHVVTNYHVAGNTTRILCTLPSQESIEAEVVAHDPMTDLSVLKLKLNKRKDTTIPIPFASLGNSAELRVGDYVLAMGNPFALASSLTLGVVSNPSRVFTSFTGSDIEDLELEEGEKTGLFTAWIQHDALILPGNSGGPLVNMKGEVVGINELGGGGMGFAIPSNLVAVVVNQALTFGEVRRGWLGVTFQPSLKLGVEKGALVSYVGPSSPAEKAGLAPGDVLLSLGGAEVSARFFEEIPALYRRVADLAPGAKVVLEVSRGGKLLRLDAEIAKMQKYLGEEREFRDLGISVRGITEFMALARRYPDPKGVLVTGVRPGKPADDAKPQLNGGDVITAFAGQEVENLEAFAKLAEEALAAKGKEVLVSFRRRDQSLLTVLDLSKKPPEASGGELPKPWIGLETQVLTPAVAAALGLKDRKGFRVTQVFPGTEAAKAGIAVGDVIVALNGAPLRASRPQDSEMLTRRVEALSIGEKATFTVLRVGMETEVAVVLQETPGTAIEAKTAKNEELEFAVREITFLDRIKNKWAPGQSGVLVTDATMGGWAHLGGLRGQDLIVSIDDRPVAGVAEFEELSKTLARTRPAVIKFFVLRGYRTTFVFVEPEWKE